MKTPFLERMKNESEIVVIVGVYDRDLGIIGDSFADRYRRSDSRGFFKAMVAIFTILDPPVRVERNRGGRRQGNMGF